MSQPTLDQPGLVSGAVGPISGSAGPVSGVAGPMSGPVDVSSQSNAAQQLAAIESATSQQSDQQPPKKDKSKGWTSPLTNPFQDIGQIWHDVETHTVSPVFHAASWAYRNIVARPLAMAAIYDADVNYNASQGKPDYSWFQGSLWSQAWEASAHISPGQASLMAANNDPFLHKSGLYADNVRYVDPLSKDTIDSMFHDPKAPNAWGNKIASGMADAMIGWYLDPASHLSRPIKALKGVKDAPISRTDTEAQAVAKMNAPRSVQFNNWAIGKPVSVIAEHPLVKGSLGRVNQYRYQMAALIAGAKTPEEVSLIRQVAAGLVGATRNVRAALGDLPTASKALDKLGQNSPDVAVQAANLLIPQETMEKFALSANSADEREQWLQRVQRVKANAAQQSLNADPVKAQQILDLFDSMRGRTATSAIANRLAQLQGNMKYANIRNTDAVSFFHKAWYNFPMRVYQGLSDRPEGLINHRDDQAVEYARSWLNKSSVLTADDKTDFIQRYAKALPADRMHVWQQIENQVYNKVGDAYGIDSPTMQKILTTTRAKGQSFLQAARSHAYGSVKVGDETHPVLPTTDSEVILHPKLITQLEAGAVPMANLRNLENVLERMEQTGLMGSIRAAGTNARDTLVTALDQVYGLWKPMSLMTGHRAYNHIGDDYLRGLAKLGGLVTVQNATEGAANFLRNRAARISRNALMRNQVSTWERAVGEAQAGYEGLLAQYKTQRKIPEIADADRITPLDLQTKKQVWKDLAAKKPTDIIQAKHQIGIGQFRIAGSNQLWDEVFGGPNGDYARWLTSSHASFMSMVDDAAHRNHSLLTNIRTRNFGTIRATDDVARHTRAYVHYVRNQLRPDPVARQILEGRDLNDVADWLRSSAAGRAHQRALHIGDVNDHVNTVAEMVKTHLPFDGMRDDALAGKFGADTIEKYMPNAGSRPDISADINLMVHGGDPTVGFLKRTMEGFMHLTGSLPDDVMVRHPVFNSLYKNRLTDSVQSWMTKTGEKTITPDMAGLLQRSAMTGARKDLQNLVYDVSRFNDLGHTLRFVSPFFNAWFNAMTSWSKLFLQNPNLLGRSYEAKRALWDSPFSVDITTGKKADVNTPWDQTAFVGHLPKGLARMLGGLGTVPIDARTLISPTYIDSVGNPGFGPLVAIPANQMVKDFPSLMNQAVVRSMLNNFVDKNSMQQLVPSSARDVNTLVQILMGAPDESANHAKTAWSIYQEQYYDYLNGQRAAPPNWNDVQTQASFLTVLDLVVNRLAPLGFKPAPSHQFFADEYRRMQATDPKNARQNFYDKYGPAAMMFTQSLSTDPTGIPATVGATVAAKKYASLLSQFPELGAVIVGPEGNGNFDDMAYQWEIANGLRQKLSPADAAKQAMINLGWAEYGQARAAVNAQLQARGLKSLNEAGARDLKAQLTAFVGHLGDPTTPAYNRDWYANYTSFNQNAYQNRISALLTMAQDPKLLANPTRSDIRSLQAYSQLRDTTYAELQKRPSHSLKAAANFDIAQRYDEQVAQMMQDDTKFAQLYDRYLSRDDWKEPV